MNLQIDLAEPSAPPNEQPSFNDVVAYLRGVSDAVHAMKRSANSTWPTLLDSPFGAKMGKADSLPPDPERRKASRLTLRYGETSIPLEGILVFGRAAAAFRATSERGGARFVDLGGADDDASDAAEPALRGTLPYWAPAVSLVPMRSRELGAGVSEPPFSHNEPDQVASLPYSALALSLVPVALGIASQWPDDESGERVSAIRLRSAPISPELYALTGTDDVWDR